MVKCANYTEEAKHKMRSSNERLNTIFATVFAYEIWNKTTTKKVFFKFNVETKRKLKTAGEYVNTQELH